jgi:threonyl-tRNA synthetase
LLPISDNYNGYAEKISEVLNFSDIRGLVDARSEKVGKKIRDAEMAKIPFMLIIGEKEVKEGLVSVRKRGEGDLGAMSIDKFQSLVEDAVSKELSQEI